MQAAFASRAQAPGIPFGAHRVSVRIERLTPKARTTSRSPGSRASRPAAAAAMVAPTAPASLLREFTLSSMSKEQRKEAVSRPSVDMESITETVRPIIEQVRTGGDAALRELSAKFDRVTAADLTPCVPIEELDEPEIAAEAAEAFTLAYGNIRRFHEAQQTEDLEVETSPGVVCRRVSRAIRAVGLYVPGGSAVLPSTALMLAVPAAIAGCSTIVLATPPRPDGSISPEVLYCARLAGVTHVLRAGGAQAVAALAYGTESTPKVDKILGPGNQYVTGAKVVVSSSSAQVAIDMPAGPSEVMVVADGDADPTSVALDLLAQAEHGPDSQAVLVALPGLDVDAVRAALARELDALPRHEVAARALSHSRVVLASSTSEAVGFADDYAPEHLIVNTRDCDDWPPLVSNSGSVFLGPHTPESVGDYASGTNHTLPTYGYARMYSGVSLDSYLRKMTIQKLTRRGLEGIGPAVATMATIEGLDAHRRAVTVRLGLEEPAP